MLRTQKGENQPMVYNPNPNQGDSLRIQICKRTLYTRLMHYPRYARLIAPARPSASLWRLAGGVGLLMAAFLALAYVYSWIITAVLPDSAWGMDGNGVDEATTPWGALTNLFVFAPLIAALGLAMAVAHRRPLIQLIGPVDLALAQGRRVFLVVAALYAVMALIPLPDSFEIQSNLAVRTWISFLPLAVLGLLIQVSAEELIFRGYLQSQLAARFPHPFIWMILPSALFGVLHYQPVLLGNGAWLVVAWATLFGLAAADLTARSGTLGPAIALHLINNFGAILFIAPQGSFDGLALYTYPFGLDHLDMLYAWMPIDLMMLLCSWLAARLALRV
ncbi:CPBP family intramembrane metalloprotease [Rhodobacteraceae bacterium KMM 6894]|nr:CPBP family intramembrane metalloprotease [Rhodobacteraceae bacterium KMM 6894]